MFETFLFQLRYDLQQLKIPGQLTPTLPTVRIGQETGAALCTSTKNAPQPSVDKINRADDQIDDVMIAPPSGEAANSHSQSAMLQQFLPAATIEPFDGDPRKWDHFIMSFKALVHDVVPSDAQRIAILRQLLSPRLRASISPSLHAPNLYGRALSDLRRLFGDPNLIIDAHIKALLDIAPMKSGNDSDVTRFFYEVHGAVSTLRAYGAASEPSSRATLQAVVSKLNRKMQTIWAKRLYDLRPRPANLCDLDEWLEETVTIQNNVPLSAHETGEQHERKYRSKEFRRQLNVLASAGPLGCPLCGSHHQLAECSTFSSSSPQQRAETLKQYGRCFACFEPNHRAKTCKQRRPCNVDGCRLKHHLLLHGASRVFPTPQLENSQPSEPPLHVGSNSVVPSSEVFLSVVRAKLVSSDSESLEVNVLLNPGSEATLIREDIARKAELTGPTHNIRLSTFHGSDPALRCQAVSFKLQSLDGQHTFTVDTALTVPMLNVAHRRADFSRLKEIWPDLRGINFGALRNEDVTVLVGMDLVEAHEQIRILRPPKGVKALRAVETPFGWCIIGRSPTCTGSQRQAPTSKNVCHVRLNAQEQDLAMLVKNLWSVESLGIRQSNRELLSAEDRLAMDILQSTTRKIDGRYVCSMLWRDPTIVIPDSLATARARFATLERRFNRNSKFAGDYANVVSEYLEAGHAKPAPPDSHDSRYWVPPHHAVENRYKPGKLRDVFDASARTDGMSLNDMLLTGSDVLTSLFGLLIRFREHPVAVSADITKMFHQVRVPEADQSMLRFLWRKPYSDEPVECLQMTVHIFGAVCSPAVSTYVLRRTAEDHCKQFRSVWRKVLNNFYVDNYLDSFASETEAVTYCNELTKLLSCGGFHLTKWTSSSRSVLQTFPNEERSQPSLDIGLDPLPTERTLGLFWDSDNDSFRSRLRPISATSSKRSMLRIVSSIFDPFGFVSPVTLQAKRILRYTWLLKIGCDDELPDVVTSQWKKWLAELPLIESLTVPRALMSKEIIESTQIHLFSDASESGYGCIAYLRKLHAGGNTTVSFICSKARVSPLKYRTILRLELRAALISSRLGSTLQEEFRITTSGVFYWTDSLTVLHWLQSTGRRYSTFVTNRVAKILDNSTESQWRYVPTQDNPADHCSRGLFPSRFLAEHTWFTGPSFLYKMESYWPRPPDHCVHEADGEEVQQKWAGYACIASGPLNEAVHR